MSKKRPSAKPTKSWSRDDARFQECLDCRFFKPLHADKNCVGCEAGENFEELVEELDPYALNFLSRKSR